MIDELHAQNVALIRDAHMLFSEGLTVITGETGSGKTALLSALQLLIGERADTHDIRQGADGLLVEGRVFLPDSSEEGLVVSRSLSAKGRGRVSLDGHMSNVSQLAETVGATVDLCGQHAHQQLLDAASHKALLSSWGYERLQPLETTYAQAYESWHQAAKELDRLKASAGASQEVLEQESFVLDRIAQVDPQPGEYEELLEALPKAEHAEQLIQSLHDAQHQLSGEGKAEDCLYEAASSLQQALVVDPELESYAQRLQSVSIELEDIAQSLSSQAHKVEVDPEQLAWMQQRAGALQGLMRIYGPGMEQVLARREAAQRRLDEAEHFDEALEEAESRLSQAAQQLSQAAAQLVEAQQQLAPELAEAITAQMQRLQMSGASVVFQVEPLAFAQLKATGPSRIQLLYKPGAASDPLPLARIASGGEVSRVMLAIKVVLGAGDTVETLVFDEVDAGVGGAVALSLAQVLSDLARTHQVIVVTHLAQIAVMGDSHYVVSKKPGDVPETLVEPVEGSERISEIARMLSGDTSQESLAHAAQMLKETGHER